MMTGNSEAAYQQDLADCAAMKSALLRIGVRSLVSILWWHLFSNGAIAWTMILGLIFLLGSRNSR